MANLFITIQAFPVHYIRTGDYIRFMTITFILLGKYISVIRPIFIVWVTETNVDYFHSGIINPGAR